MKKTRFPKGWDEARARRLLRHYEGQTEDEAVAEDVLELQRAKQEDSGEQSVPLEEVRKRFGLGR